MVWITHWINVTGHVESCRFSLVIIWRYFNGRFAKNVERFMFCDNFTTCKASRYLGWYQIFIFNSQRSSRTSDVSKNLAAFSRCVLGHSKVESFMFCDNFTTCKAYKYFNWFHSITHSVTLSDQLHSMMRQKFFVVSFRGFLFKVFAKILEKLLSSDNITIGF